MTSDVDDAQAAHRHVRAARPWKPADDQQAADEPVDRAIPTPRSLPDRPPPTARERTDRALQTAPAVKRPIPPVLLLPQGWLLDPLVHDRLHRQLERTPQSVSAVVAPEGDLPPGSSYRVHAERLAMQPLSSVSRTTARLLRGAVLVRPGVRWTRHGVHVEVVEGTVLVDHGAHAHNPWRSAEPLRPATVLGRPPFPWRPVVTFVTDATDPARTAWVTGLVNDLIHLDVEARLLTPEVSGALHLTRPCAPDEQSIEVLQPDVIVPVDDTLRAPALRWCLASRRRVVLELDATAHGSHILPWHRHDPERRARARIGCDVTAEEVAALVNRLCSGPHPAPPLPPDDPSATEGLATATPATGSSREAAVALRTARGNALTRRPAVRRSVVMISGAVSSTDIERLDGLVDRIAAAGDAAELLHLDDAAAETLPPADVLLLHAPADTPGLRELLDQRRGAKQVTVVDLSPTDFVVDLTSAPPTLSSGARDLAVACGHATCPSIAALRTVRSLGTRAAVLPTLLPRARLDDLSRARHDPYLPRPPVIGWDTGRFAPASDDDLETVAQALLECLEHRADLEVDVVGHPERIPEPLLRSPRVTVTAATPGVHTLGRWSLQIWTPPRLQTELHGDLRSIAEAAFAGVPTVLDRCHRGALDGLAVPELYVDDARRVPSWRSLLEAVLDDPWLHLEYAEQAIRRARARFGSTASVHHIDRFLRWALHGAHPGDRPEERA